MGDKALELYPNHYMPLFNKGVVYKKLNKLEESISNYKLSIEDNENYSYSYLNLAVIYKELKDYKRAIDIISKGILNNTEEGFLYYNRACYYTYLEQYEKAIKDLYKAVELYPEFVKYIKEDEELHILKDRKDFMWKGKE